VRHLLVIVLLLAPGGAIAAEQVPLPRPRPIPAAVTPGEAAKVPAPSACRLRLAQIARFEPLPPIEGPGECGAYDAVKLQAILLADKTSVTVNPPATLNCPMAEAIAHWARDAVVPTMAKLGALREIENYDSYDCRGRNRVVGAKISEHGKGNALDVRAFKLAGGRVIRPTDVKVAKPLRQTLKAASCARFTTVLGPGSDGYHEAHIHLDLARRRGGYRLCHWQIYEPIETVASVPAVVPLPRPRPSALRR
jgi:hypothetical protein